MESLNKYYWLAIVYFLIVIILILDYNMTKKMLRIHKVIKYLFSYELLLVVICIAIGLLNDFNITHIEIPYWLIIFLFMPIIPYLFFSRFVIGWPWEKYFNNDEDNAK